MIDCGLGGNWANLSITTFLGGGGYFLPLILINFMPNLSGGFGGSSRNIKGSGVTGRHGCWRMTSGGAVGVKLFGLIFNFE